VIVESPLTVESVAFTFKVPLLPANQPLQSPDLWQATLKAREFLLTAGAASISYQLVGNLVVVSVKK
jgi:hypothetical protein